jgi:hypothetical protein
MEGKKPTLQSLAALSGGSGSALHQIKRRSKNPPKVGSPSGTPREIDAGLVIAGHRFEILPPNAFCRARDDHIDSCSDPRGFVNVTSPIK